MKRKTMLFGFMSVPFSSGESAAIKSYSKQRKRKLNGTITPYLFLFALFICIGMFSCGNPNPFAPHKTSEQPGISFSEDKLLLDNDEYIYRQEISVYNPEGVQYAYRLSTLSSSLPAGYAADEDGWLYFRSPGDTSNTPLTEPGPHRTIWTNQARLSLDFASTNKIVKNMVVRVEVQVKTEDGSITTLTSPFKSDRIFGSRITVPFSMGATVGMGLEFGLNEIIGNVYVEGLYAHHFMFRLNTLDSDMNVTAHGAWHSTLDCPNIRKVVLNASSNPALTVSPQNTWLQFESYVVSRQGVEESSPETVYFKTVQGNKPVAMIYAQSLVALGQYHYTLAQDTNPAYYYEQIPSLSSKKNRQLWTTSTAVAAINSPDLKLHLRWGYSGEYYTDNPFSTAMNRCLNEDGQYYYSKIVAYDLRLDGSPYPSNSGFVDPQIVMHNDGSSWLRVQNLLESCRHGILSNLQDGLHVIEVCAVDQQGVYSDPAMQRVNLMPYKPVSQRSGILIVDDSPAHSTYSPEQIVDNMYSNMVPGTWGEVVEYDVAGSGNPYIYQGSCLLQNYKAIVWHSDNPNNQANLIPNMDALDCYLSNGGNMVLSGTNKLYSTFSELSSRYPEFLYNTLGIPYSSSFGYLGNSITTNPFFVEAHGLNGLSDIGVETESSFCSLVNSRNGLSIVTYFNPDTGLDYVYGLGCKPVNSPSYPPTQEQYDQYSQKYVAYKYSHSGSNLLVLGFPLSYMVQAEAVAAVQNIMGGILGRASGKGGAK